MRDNGGVVFELSRPSGSGSAQVASCNRKKRRGFRSCRNPRRHCWLSSGLRISANNQLRRL